MYCCISVAKKWVKTTSRNYINEMNKAVNLSSVLENSILTKFPNSDSRFVTSPVYIFVTSQLLANLEFTTEKCLNVRGDL